MVKGFAIAIVIFAFYAGFLAVTISMIEDNDKVWNGIDRKWKRAVILFTPGLLFIAVILNYFIETITELLNRKG